MATARRTGRSSSRGCARSGSSRRRPSRSTRSTGRANYMTAPGRHDVDALLRRRHVRAAAPARRAGGAAGPLPRVDRGGGGADRRLRQRARLRHAERAQRRLHRHAAAGASRRGRRFMSRDADGIRAPRARSQWLAAAEDGGVWADGCPWREVGLWDRDADGDARPRDARRARRRRLARPHGAVRRRSSGTSCGPGTPTASSSSRAPRWSSTPSGATRTRYVCNARALVRRHERSSRGGSTRTSTGRSAARRVAGAEAIAAEHVKMLGGMQTGLAGADGRSADAASASSASRTR